MFQSDTIYVILILAGFGFAAYFYADSKSKRTWIAKLEELNETLRAELKDWQNKALFKHGNTPLGHETRPKPPKSDSVTVAPTVVHRGELEARHAQTEPKTPPQTNIHADRVSYERVTRGVDMGQVLEKARQIKSD